MKPILKIGIATLALTFTSSLQAQTNSKNTTETKTGFWVVESNIRSPKNSVVYFYNEDKKLVYKESVTGRRININRKKTRKQLNTVLEQSLLSWEREKTMKENQQWLAAKL
jgi:hypothetical protein